jgi:hypothetical protein
MYLGNLVPGPYRFHGVIICAIILVAIVGYAVSGVVANQVSFRHESLKDFDRMVDGKYSRYIESITSECSKETNQITTDFIDSIKSDAAPRDAYRSLLVDALGGKIADDWGHITKSCPKSVLLEALLAVAQDGEPLEGVFLQDIRISGKTGYGRDGATRFLTISDNENWPPHWAPWGSKRTRPPDFSLYYRYLSSHDENYSSPLIEYMILRDPVQAIHILFEMYPKAFESPESAYVDVSVIQKRLWEVRTRVNTDEPGADVYAAFERLCSSPDWWNRLFALSVVDQIPWVERWMARSTALLEELQSDDAHAVRIVARQLAIRNGVPVKAEP